MKKLGVLILLIAFASLAFAGELLDGAYNYNTMDLDIAGKIYYAFDFGTTLLIKLNLMLLKVMGG